MSDNAALLEALRGDVTVALRPALVGLGLRADDAHISLHKVHHRPGLDVSAGFTVTYPGSDHDGGAYIVATSARLPENARVVAARLAGRTVSVWRHPDDPYLPGLGPAHDADVAALWVDAWPVAVRLASYRPIRRAVLRYEGGGRTWFAKVVRPSRLADLRQRQTLLSDAGVSPAVLGTPAPGTLLLESARGTSLANTLAAALAGRADLPEPASIVALLDRLPSTVMTLTARPSWSEHLSFHGEAAASAQPSHRREIGEVGARLRRIIDAEPVAPLVPAHGDFYEANVFVDDGVPRQIIDVDAVGPGRREDDLACLLGHMAVLPVVSPRHFAGMEAVVDSWAAAFEATVPSPAGLRARVAAVVLSLVAGAAPENGEARLAISHRWVDRAEGRVGERPSGRLPRVAAPDPEAAAGTERSSPPEFVQP